MIFEILWTSAQAGELLLVDGGFCRYHLRRDGQLTILEILVLPKRHRQGIGTAMLRALQEMKPCCIVAKCPADLEANGWYEHMGFRLREVTESRSGRELCVWCYQGREPNGATSPNILCSR